ncbi:MAG: DUF4097 family beta strand repeat-containing protein [Pyrinomonadaceae bacterium]
MSRYGLQVNKLGISLCLVVITAGVYGQATPAPKPKKSPVRVEVPASPEPPDFHDREMSGQGVSEKALLVDANVNIKLPCISEAKVTINGWDRNEIRVYIKNGSKIGFRVHEKDPASGKPVWVLITSLAGDIARYPGSECLSGERIEIDVPMKASLMIKGKETETRIDSVKKVDIKNLGGKLALRNISGGIAAVTFEGDVTVENSGGQISLETSTGNVIAYEVSPGQIGDTFTTKTRSGTITLQKVDHRQIEATSVSGSVVFNGKFLPGGLYTMNTTNGSIKMSIPGDSSCKIIASYGYGTVNSAIPMKILTETVSQGGKSLVALIGAGDATVNVTTSSGTINIGKQQ